MLDFNCMTLSQRLRFVHHAARNQITIDIPPARVKLHFVGHLINVEFPPQLALRSS